MGCTFDDSWKSVFFWNTLLFRQIDTDGSKSLSLGEIILYLKSITNDICEENIEKIFSNLDKSGDRSVDFEEFKVR